MLKLFKSQQTLIAEIHSEFDNAQERLLTEAKKIIESTPENLKAERLIKIGFTASAIAETHIKNKELLVKSTEEANLIEYYKVNYPFQKFVTEKELDRICKKYNLIYAPVANYNKNVPDKNLTDIENCGQLKSVDRAKDITFTEVKYGFDIMGISFPRAKLLGLPMRIYDFQETFFARIDDYIRERFPAVSHRDYICRKGVVHHISKQGLFIAAPKTHFNLKGLSKHGLLNSTFTIIQPKDPIVFRYVKGGVQIITKWGLEGKDEALLNEVCN